MKAIPSSLLDKTECLEKLPETPDEAFPLGEITAPARFSAEENLKAANSPTDISLALCLTLYNEPLPSLILSLEAIAEALHCLSEQAECGGQIHLALNLVIDGSQSLNEQVHTWLLAHQLAHPTTGQGLRPGWYIAELALPQSNVQLTWFTCLKPSNGGKLDSHRLFFECLCVPFQPEVVFQIDTGTQIFPNGLIAAIDYLRIFQQQAAVVGRVVPVAPEPQAGALEVVQYIRRLRQAVCESAHEEIAGYICVVPGQFCAFRWRALSAEVRAAYLRGLEPANLLDEFIFLTEDRVIGRELVQAKPAWKLGYAPDMCASADRSEAGGEVLRQRRRWNNGAQAARLRIVLDLPSFLLRKDRSIKQKCHFASGVLWQLLQLIFIALTPAISVLFFAWCVSDMLYIANLGGTWGSLALVAAFCCLAWCSHSGFSINSRWASTIYLLRDASWYVLAGLWLVFSPHPLAVAVYFVCLFLNIFLIALKIP